MHDRKSKHLFRFDQKFEIIRTEYNFFLVLELQKMVLWKFVLHVVLSMVSFRKVIILNSIIIKISECEYFEPSIRNAGLHIYLFFCILLCHLTGDIMLR